ncbi:MAG: hypothetical protein KAT57_09545 [Candidatus Lokiarchaeota archaeon]|nr:hypothetical protein [Candidatus Lokiarchaeota archaeon]
MNVSITHELDLDGLGSQAIIQRYYTHYLKKNKSELILHYSHYTNFIDKIKIILEAKILPERLIISDMGFNDDFKKLYSLFKKSRERGCKIFWFDHHIIDINHENELKRSLDLYLNDLNLCAAEIIKDYYLPEDLIAIKIAKFSRDIDFHTKKYNIASNLQSIIAYNRGYELDEVKKRIVYLMSNGIFENDWYTEQLRIVKNWEERQSDFALKHTQLIKIEGFGKLVISFGKIGGGRLCTLLKENYPVAKVFIGIDLRFNEITLRSDYINCRELANSFYGGGHKDRAGFRYEKIFMQENKIDQIFIRKIKDKILLYRT